jgi:hypothetical protein
MAAPTHKGAGQTPIHSRSDSWQVEVTVDTLKVEHVGNALRRLRAAAESLHQEGLDVQITYSVTRNRENLEWWTEWVDREGRIKDIQPWEIGHA